jgi:hypothetical protein
MHVIRAEQAGVVHHQRQAGTYAPHRTGRGNKKMNRTPLSVLKSAQPVQSRSGETTQRGARTSPQRGHPQRLDLGKRPGLRHHDPPARLLPAPGAHPPAQRIARHVLHRTVDAEHAILLAEQLRQSVIFGLSHAASIASHSLNRRSPLSSCG